jgi:hypothetical protein
VSQGIVYIAFGEEYDKLAAHTIEKSKRFVSIPITVLTNLKKRNEKWKESPEINFVFIDVPTENNREIKTLLYKYSPYDETLYIDCDSVIVKKGIETIFEHFGNNDLILQANAMPTWVMGKRYFKIYRDCAMQFGCSLPLNIYQGGIFAFRKSETISIFFDLWNRYWRARGCGRDMPSLACAVQNSGISHSVVNKKDHGFFIFGDTPGTIIVHPMTVKALSDRFGVPRCESYKEFDKGRRSDWNLVFFDNESNEIVENDWIKAKFDRKKRIQEKQFYISKYLPNIHNGGLDILDLATGPGEFLEICISTGNRAIGIDYNSGMIGRNIDSLYEKYNQIRHKEKDLPVIYADCAKVFENQHLGFLGKKYDVINCQLAINFIFRDVFNHHPELGEYKNNGEWIFGDVFNSHFNMFFRWCSCHLKNNGVLMLAALHAENAAEYSDKICSIAREHGFCLEQSDKNLNHKFRGVTRYA